MSPRCQALHLHSKAGNNSSLFYRRGNWGLREFRDLSQITESAQLTRRFTATLWGTSQTLLKWVLGPSFYRLRKWGPKQFSIMPESQTVKRRTGVRILTCSTLKLWVPSLDTYNSKSYTLFFWGFIIQNPAGKQIRCSYGDIYVVPWAPTFYSTPTARDLPSARFSVPRALNLGHGTTESVHRMQKVCRYTWVEKIRSLF